MPRPSSASWAPQAPAPARDPSTVLLNLEGVDHRFANGTEALRGFDLVVRAGEFVALLGPSGCGKSTVLKLVAGLLRPTAGRIDAHADDLAFVFQSPTLMPWATVAGNVALPLRLRGVPRLEARARVEAALEGVGLADFERTYPRELSGGMAMRVALARALVTGPRLLLMDEPFAALDEITRQRLNDELLALKDRFGWTIVFVTHSVFEAAYLSDRMLVMTPGPGRVAAEVPIIAPVPRGEAYRASAAYALACAEARAVLRRVMEPA